jgi:hypothetical protein
MEVMGSTKEMNRDEMIQFVLGCRHPSGGFGGNVSHDPHLLYTLSAIQVLAESLFSPLFFLLSPGVETDLSHAPFFPPDSRHSRRAGCD